MKPAVGLGAIRALDYTMLLCDDVATMRAFYSSVLGLEVQRETPGRYVEFRLGASILALRRRGRTYDGPAPEPNTASVQLAFKVSVDDVDLAARQLLEHGIEPLEPITTLHDFGHRVLFFPDPERNIIEIYAEI